MKITMFAEKYSESEFSWLRFDGWGWDDIAGIFNWIEDELREVSIAIDQTGSMGDVEISYLTVTIFQWDYFRANFHKISDRFDEAWKGHLKDWLATGIERDDAFEFVSTIQQNLDAWDAFAVDHNSQNPASPEGYRTLSLVIR